MGGETTEDANTESAPNFEPHSIRITDHGKIHSFVSFALKFLQVSHYRLTSVLSSSFS